MRIPIIQRAPRPALGGRKSALTRARPVRTQVPAALEQEKPFTSQEIAVAGLKPGEVPADVKIDANAQRTIDWFHANKTPEQVLLEASRPRIRPQTPEEAKALRSKFETRQQERLQRADDAVVDYQVYAEVTRRAAEQGLTINSPARKASNSRQLNTILREVDPRSSSTEANTAQTYAELRTRVLTRFTQTDVFRNLFPEVAQQPMDQQMIIAERLFANASDFQAAVSGRVEQFRLQTQGLKPTESSADAAAHDRITGVQDRIKRRLSSESGAKINLEDAERQLQQGRDVEGVMEDMTLQLSRERGVSHPTAVRQIVTLTGETTNLNARIHENEAVLAGLDNELQGSGMTSARRQSLETKRTELTADNLRLTSQRDNLEQRIEQHADDYDGDLKKDTRVYREVEDDIYGRADAKGVRQGGIKSELDVMKREVDEQARQESIRPKSERAVEQATEQERLLGDYEGLMSDSMIDTMRERSQLLTDAARRKGEADAQRLERENKNNEARAVRRLTYGIEDEYSPLDRRGVRCTDKQRMAEDFNIITSGKDGLHRVFLRILSGGDNPLVNFDTIYPPERRADIIAQVGDCGSGSVDQQWAVAKSRLWQTMDLESFAQTEPGQMLERMVQEQGTNFTTQFTAGLLEAQSFGERHGVGTLAISSAEWRRMYKYHRGGLKAGGVQYEELKQWEEDMKDEGVDISNLGLLTALSFFIKPREENEISSTGSSASGSSTSTSSHANISRSHAPRTPHTITM